MANTREVMGEQACLDALVANTLTSFEDDGVTKIGQYGLYKRSALTAVKLPSCSRILNYGLAECTGLESVEILGSTSQTTLGSHIFDKDSKLKHLVISCQQKIHDTSTPISTLRGTPIAALYGAIYVQDSLVASYRSDSNWNIFHIAPISSYPLSSFETISDSWDQIIAATQDGSYASKYNVGDIKSVESSGGSHYYVLAGKDVDVLASDGTTTVATTWIEHKGVHYFHRMNPSSTTSGGWESCEYRSYLASVLSEFPANIRAAIKEVRKYSDTYENGAIVHDHITADELWIPSAREMGGSSYETLGPVYTGVFPDEQSRIAYNATSFVPVLNGSRTVANATQFASVYTTGSFLNFQSAGNSVGCRLGFCI